MNETDELIKRLDVLISLQLEQASQAQKTISITDKIKKLSDLGLKPAEIASILGKKTNYITANISSAKKTKKGNK